MDEIIIAKKITIFYDIDGNTNSTPWIIDGNSINDILYKLALLFEKHNIYSWGFKTEEVFEELQSNCSTPEIIESSMEETLNNNITKTLK